MVDFVKSIPELRARVPVTQQWAYFETASTGLVPDFVYDGVRRYMDARYHIGGNSVWEFPRGERGGGGSRLDRQPLCLAEEAG